MSERIDGLAAKYGTVHTVRKKCYQCGTEWDGNAFAEYPKDRPPLPGICKSCGDKEDAELERIKAGRTHSESGSELPELHRPRRATDDLDDDVHLRIAP